MPGESHLSRVHLVKPTRFRTLVIGTTAVEAPPEARVPHGVGASPVTPARATIARSPGTSRLISGLSRRRRECLESHIALQPIRRCELLQFDIFDKTGHYRLYAHPHPGQRIEGEVLLTTEEELTRWLLEFGASYHVTPFRS